MTKNKRACKAFLFYNEKYAAGEGFEEAVSELADPVAKTIYKGKDSFSDYTDAEYWKGVGQAAITGAAISGIYGGAFDAIGGGVKQGDIQSILSDIEATKKQATNRKANGKLTPERARQADSQTLGDLRLIEKILKGVNDRKRAELIKNNNLSGLFEADGSLNADYAEVLSKDSIFDRRYYSENQRGLEKNIDEDIKWVNMDLRARRDNFADELYNEDVKYSFVGTKKDGTREYKSDFDESVPQEERVKLFKSRIASVFNLGMVELKTDTKKLQIRGDKFTAQKNLYGDDEAQPSEQDAKVNALYDMADILQTAKYLPNKTAMEPSYQNPAVSPKNKAHAGVKYWYKFQNDIIFDGVPYTVTFNIRDKGKEQYQYFIDFENKKAGRLNQPYSLKRPPTSIDNRPTLHSIAQNSEMSIENGENIDENLWDDNVWEVGVFDGEMSEKAQARYSKAQKVINALNKLSGHEIGLVVIKGNSKINGFLSSDGRRIYISADNFENGKWAGTLVHEYTHFEEGTKEYNELVELLESDADLGERMSKVVLNKKAYGFDAEAIKEIRSKIESGVEVSKEERWAYEEYRSELEAHMSEAVLGTESFIDKVIRTDASLAEKILGKIGELKAAFERIGDPEAQAQHKRLAEAERLYLRAAEEAGYKYQGGKMVSVDEEEEKENISSGIYSFKTSQSGMANDVLIPYNEEITTYIKQQGNYIVYDFEMLKRVVDLAFDNPNLKATIYFGSIDTKILDKIENSIPNLPQEVKGKLFKNNSNYSIAATFDSIRHIVDEKKLSREDVLDYLDHLADTIVDFDSVTFDYYIKGNEKNPGLLFKKQFSDGKYISFDFVSQKKRSLMMQSLYLDNVDYQKRKSANALLMRNASTSTPEAQAGQTPTNRISQNFNSVNPKSNFSFKEDSTDIAKTSAEEAKLLERLDKAEEKAKEEHQKRKDAESYNKTANRVLKLVRDINNWKKGVFESAAEANGDVFKSIIGELTRVDFKGNVSTLATRKAMKKLAEKGFKVDGKTPERVFFMMDDAYQKASKA